MTITAVTNDAYKTSCSCTVIVHSNEQLVLPAKDKAVMDESFLGTGVEDVVLPDGAASIGRRAFADCKDLVLIYMPDSIKQIVADAFAGSGSVTFICESENAAAAYARANGIAYIVR